MSPDDNPCPCSSFIYWFNFSGWWVMARATTNKSALEQTLAELERMGRLEKVDTAAVQMVRSMAAALDGDSSNAALWRQYREALGELTVDDSDSSVDDAVDALYSEVGDSPKA